MSASATTEAKRALRRHEHRSVAEHPMRELLRNLATPTSDDVNQQAITENAETVMAVCQNGMAALGHLLAHSAPVIEDGTIGADSLEALGWLMAEIGDLSVECMLLAARHRKVAAEDEAS